MATRAKKKLAMSDEVAEEAVFLSDLIASSLPGGSEAKFTAYLVVFYMQEGTCIPVVLLVTRSTLVSALHFNNLPLHFLL